ncbi:hypothetical protein AVEN_42369-1 [Araneus ventricosus]|uniref:Uncharacterized protein n=2 Tax=Araneus ventricosus TaxID=182803 RepID=A0A4Y2UU72_ARAVE|nr:hypothetical protein AVEN_42369-1 [Araneus ventricosus]
MSEKKKQSGTFYRERKAQIAAENEKQGSVLKNFIKIENIESREGLSTTLEGRSLTSENFKNDNIVRTTNKSSCEFNTTELNLNFGSGSVNRIGKRQPNEWIRIHKVNRFVLSLEPKLNIWLLLPDLLIFRWKCVQKSNSIKIGDKHH